MIKKLSVLTLAALVIVVACKKSSTTPDPNTLNITGKWTTYTDADWFKYTGTDSIEDGGNFASAPGSYWNMTSNGLWISYDPTETPPYDTLTYKTIGTTEIVLNSQDTLYVLKYSTDTLLICYTALSTDGTGRSITEFDTTGFVRQQ
jgi:hypothetical protein